MLNGANNAFGSLIVPIRILIPRRSIWLCIPFHLLSLDLRPLIRPTADFPSAEYRFFIIPHHLASLRIYTLETD
jgi:hypothetical protein